MKGARFLLFFCLAIISVSAQDSLRLRYRIKGDLVPKSVVHSGDGLFAISNMTTVHNISFYNRNYEQVAQSYDDVDLSKYDTAQSSKMNWGAPVAGAFSDNGKYYWVVNQQMEGNGFSKSGCESCNGKNYDNSYIYKVNTWNYKVEKAIKVGAFPKYIANNDALRIVVVSNYTSGDIHVINSKTSKVLKQINVGKYPCGVAIHPSARKIYVALYGEKNIAVIDMFSWQVSYIENVGSGLRELKLDERSNSLFVSIQDEGKVAKVNLGNNKIQYLKVGSQPKAMALSNDGKMLFVANFGDHSVLKIKADSMVLKEKIKTAKNPNGIAIDEKRGELWVSCGGGEVDVFQDKAEQKRNLYNQYLASLFGKTKVEKKVEKVEPIPEIKEEPKEVKTEKKEIKSKTPEREAWIAVAGTFKDKENAEQYRNEIRSQGYVSEVLERDNGTYLVTYGSSTNKQEIEDLVKEVKSYGGDVYITKR